MKTKYVALIGLICLIIGFLAGRETIAAEVEIKYIQGEKQSDSINIPDPEEAIPTNPILPIKADTIYVDKLRYITQKVEIDEQTLTQIAQITEGQYFRATNNKTLKAIYDEIDQMEKTKISVQTYNKKTEEFVFYALIGFAFFLLELLLRYTLLKNIP